MVNAIAEPYYETLQDYADEYLEETGKTEGTTEEFATQSPKQAILPSCMAT